MPNIGATELIILLLVIVLLFGSTKLPKLAKSLGEAQKEFKKGIAENEAEAALPPADEKVTMTKAEYDALRAGQETQPPRNTPPSV